MPDNTEATVSYAGLGYVSDPFTPAGHGEHMAHWKRLVGNASANRLLAACIRARTRGVPVLLKYTREIPEDYRLIALADFLARAASEPGLDMMSLNIPLEMMRLGRIRGTLVELAELVVAVDMPATMAAWFVPQLDSIDASLPEAALVSAEQIAEARELFATDPAAAVDRYFRFDAPTLTEHQMEEVVHDAYLRSLGQKVDVEKDEETVEESAFDPLNPAPESDAAIEDAVEAQEHAPDADVREYLLVLAASRLSPVLARSIKAYGRYDDAVASQEIKITKAPRKTLAALLKFMSARWGNIVVMYDNFEGWNLIDQKAKVDVLASLTELRYIIGDTGVMVVCINDGAAPEIEEQFAAAVQIDWFMPEVHQLSHGDTTFSYETAQAWLDSASMEGTSTLRADGPELAPLVAASGNDIVTFAVLAQAALQNAAERGATTLDAAGVEAGLASAPREADA